MGMFWADLISLLSKNSSCIWEEKKTRKVLETEKALMMAHCSVQG